MKIFTLILILLTTSCASEYEPRSAEEAMYIHRMRQIQLNQAAASFGAASQNLRDFNNYLNELNPPRPQPQMLSSPRSNQTVCNQVGQYTYCNNY